MKSLTFESAQKGSAYHGYLYKGKVTQPNDIIKAILGDHPFRYHHWSVDRMHGYFLEDPKESQYQDTFAQAGGGALVVDLNVLTKAGVEFNV